MMAPTCMTDVQNVKLHVGTFIYEALPTTYYASLITSCIYIPIEDGRELHVALEAAILKCLFLLVQVAEHRISIRGCLRDVLDDIPVFDNQAIF